MNYKESLESVLAPLQEFLDEFVDKHNYADDGGFKLSRDRVEEHFRPKIIALCKALVDAGLDPVEIVKLNSYSWKYVYGSAESIKRHIENELKLIEVAEPPDWRPDEMVAEDYYALSGPAHATKSGGMSLVDLKDWISNVYGTGNDAHEFLVIADALDEVGCPDAVAVRETAEEFVKYPDAPGTSMEHLSYLGKVLAQLNHAYHWLEAEITNRGGGAEEGKAYYPTGGEEVKSSMSRVDLRNTLRTPISTSENDGVALDDFIASGAAQVMSDALEEHGYPYTNLFREAMENYRPNSNRSIESAYSMMFQAIHWLEESGEQMPPWNGPGAECDSCGRWSMNWKVGEECPECGQGQLHDLKSGRAKGTKSRTDILHMIEADAPWEILADAAEEEGYHRANEFRELSGFRNDLFPHVLEARRSAELSLLRAWAMGRFEQVNYYDPEISDYRCINCNKRIGDQYNPGPEDCQCPPFEDWGGEMPGGEEVKSYSPRPSLSDAQTVGLKSSQSKTYTIYYRFEDGSVRNFEVTADSELEAYDKVLEMDFDTPQSSSFDLVMLIEGDGGTEWVPWEPRMDEEDRTSAMERFKEWSGINKVTDRVLDWMMKSTTEYGDFQVDGNTAPFGWNDNLTTLEEVQLREMMHAMRQRHRENVPEAEETSMRQLQGWIERLDKEGGAAMEGKSGSKRTVVQLFDAGAPIEIIMDAAEEAGYPEIGPLRSVTEYYQQLIDDAEDAGYGRIPPEDYAAWHEELNKLQRWCHEVDTKAARPTGATDPQWEDQYTEFQPDDPTTLQPRTVPGGGAYRDPGNMRPNAYDRWANEADPDQAQWDEEERAMNANVGDRPAWKIDYANGASDYVFNADELAIAEARPDYVGTTPITQGDIKRRGAQSTKHEQTLPNVAKVIQQDEPPLFFTGDEVTITGRNQYTGTKATVIKYDTFSATPYLVQFGDGRHGWLTEADLDGVAGGTDYEINLDEGGKSMTTKAEQPSDSITPAKAKEMLRNPPHDKPLTPKQERMLQAAAHKNDKAAPAAERKFAPHEPHNPQSSEGPTNKPGVWVVEVDGQTVYEMDPNDDAYFGDSAEVEARKAYAQIKRANPEADAKVYQQGTDGKASAKIGKRDERRVPHSRIGGRIHHGDLPTGNQIGGEGHNLLDDGPVPVEERVMTGTADEIDLGTGYEEHAYTETLSPAQKYMADAINRVRAYIEEIEADLERLSGATNSKEYKDRQEQLSVAWVDLHRLEEIYEEEHGQSPPPWEGKGGVQVVAGNNPQTQPAPAPSPAPPPADPNAAGSTPAPAQSTTTPSPEEEQKSEWNMIPVGVEQDDDTGEWYVVTSAGQQHPKSKMHATNEDAVAQLEQLRMSEPRGISYGSRFKSDAQGKASGAAMPAMSRKASPASEYLNVLRDAAKEVRANPAKAKDIYHRADAAQAKVQDWLEKKEEDLASFSLERFKEGFDPDIMEKAEEEGMIDMFREELHDLMTELADTVAESDKAFETVTNSVDDGAVDDDAWSEYVVAADSLERFLGEFAKRFVEIQEETYQSIGEHQAAKTEEEDAQHEEEIDGAIEELDSIEDDQEMKQRADEMNAEFRESGNPYRLVFEGNEWRYNDVETLREEGYDVKARMGRRKGEKCMKSRLAGNARSGRALQRKASPSGFVDKLSSMIEDASQPSEQALGEAFKQATELLESESKDALQSQTAVWRRTYGEDAVETASDAMGHFEDDIKGCVQEIKTAMEMAVNSYKAVIAANRTGDPDAVEDAMGDYEAAAGEFHSLLEGYDQRFEAARASCDRAILAKRGQLAYENVSQKKAIRRRGRDYGAEYALMRKWAPARQTKVATAQGKKSSIVLPTPGQVYAVARKTCGDDCKCDCCTKGKCYSLKFAPNLEALDGPPQDVNRVMDKIGGMHDHPGGIKLDKGKMSATCVLATTAQDREGDVMDVAGIDTSHHKINPVAMLDHGVYYPLPIGVCRTPEGQYTVVIDPQAGECVQTTFFSQKSEMAEQVYALIDEGIINGNSIGFDPEETHPYRSPNGRKGKYIAKCRLVEATWTPLPVNPEAVRSCLAKSVVNGRPMAQGIKSMLAKHLPVRKHWEKSGYDRKRGGHTSKASTSQDVDEGEAYPENVIAYPDPSDPSSQYKLFVMAADSRDGTPIYRWEFRDGIDNLIKNGQWSESQQAVLNEGKRYADDLVAQIKPAVSGLDQSIVTDSGRKRTVRVYERELDGARLAIAEGRYKLPPEAGMEGVAFRWELIDKDGNQIAGGPWLEKGQNSAGFNTAWEEGEQYVASLPKTGEEHGPPEVPPLEDQRLEAAFRFQGNSQQAVAVAEKLFYNELAAASSVGDREDLAVDLFKKSIAAPEGSLIDVEYVGQYQPVFADDDGPASIGVRLQVANKFLEFKNKKPYGASYFLGVDQSDRKFIYLDFIGVREKYRGSKGDYVNFSMFDGQVNEAATNGFSYIKCHAAGRPGGASDLDGYYVWPNYGFDESFDDLERDGYREKVKDFRDKFPGATSVLDIVGITDKIDEHENGFDWWKANGVEMLGAKFDLTEGSKSRERWSALWAIISEKKKGRAS